MVKKSRFFLIYTQGMSCNRIHIVPLVSETIIVEHMYRDSYNKMKNVTKGLDDSLLEVIWKE